MKAVTIISPAYRRVGRAAVSKARKCLGTHVEVVSASNKDGWECKLSLDKFYREPLLFFDADLWFLQPWKPEFPGIFSAVHDSAAFNPHSFCHQDCKSNGLDAERYINSGLFMCDLSDPKTRKVFQTARKYWRKNQKKKLCEDKTDQYHLNKALLDHQTPIQLLPTIFNFYLQSAKWGQFPFIPRNIVGLHGAGIPPKDKYEQLKIQAQVFGGDNLPMCPDAVHFIHNRQFLFP